MIIPGKMFGLILVQSMMLLADFQILFKSDIVIRQPFQFLSNIYPESGQHFAHMG